MVQISSIVNIITTPVLLAIIIGVAYQFGYITYVKDADGANLTVSLKTLEHRLKGLEVDIGNLGNQTLTQILIQDLETRLDGVQKILETVKDETRRDIDKLMSGEITTDRHVYVTQRDKVIFLMLGGLCALQIGLVTSIYFLFRKFRHQSTDSSERDIQESKFNDGAQPIEGKSNFLQTTQHASVVNDTRLCS